MYGTYVAAERESKGNKYSLVPQALCGLTCQWLHANALPLATLSVCRAVLVFSSSIRNSPSYAL